tara:strand:+ start:828 stop:932 length:105 start_codon:yes stop_codon:yes gene_type:complete
VLTDYQKHEHNVIQQKATFVVLYNLNIGADYAKT